MDSDPPQKQEKISPEAFPLTEEIPHQINSDKPHLLCQAPLMTDFQSVESDKKETIPNISSFNSTSLQNEKEPQVGQKEHQTIPLENQREETVAVSKTTILNQNMKSIEKECHILLNIIQEELKIQRNSQTKVVESMITEKTFENCLEKESPKKREEQFDLKDQFKRLLNKTEIEDQEEIQECWNLLNQKKFQQLKKYPNKQYRRGFALQLDDLLERQQRSEICQGTIHIKKELENILRRCEVDEEDFEESHLLFASKDFNSLKKIPNKQFRKQFADELEQLLKKIPQEKSEFDPIKDLISLLKQAEITDQDEITECVNLFEQKQIKILKKCPNKEYRKKFEESLDKLIEKNQERQKIYQKKIKEDSILSKNFNSESELWLQQINLTKEQFNTIKENIKNNNVNYLLQLPQKQRISLIDFFKREGNQLKSTSMQTQIRLELCSLMHDDDVEDIINKIKQKANYTAKVSEEIVDKIENIQKDFITEVKVTFSKDNTKIYKFNEIVIKNDKRLLEKTIQRALKTDSEDYLIYHQNARIALQNLDLTLKKVFNLQVYQCKTYICIYGGKKMKINLLPEAQIKLNKELILKELLKKNLVYQEQEPFRLEKIKLMLKFKTDSKTIPEEDVKSDLSFADYENENGQITTIYIEVNLHCILYFEDSIEDYFLSSSTTIKKLREIINQKLVPYESQVLVINVTGQRHLITEEENQYSLSKINSGYKIVFQLQHRVSTQFYGFNKNYNLSFESFSECFIQNPDKIQSMIKDCQFNKCPQEEERFIKQFFQSLYSGIKKRFLIKTILDKYRFLVSELKHQLIWIPKPPCKGIKVNESFVLAYMLRNAEDRLKIEIMNLLKDNLPIPLYYRSFDTIFDVEEKLDLNKELLWVLPKAFTISSFGLHNEEKIDFERGKSALLNEIFVTNFQEYQNKQAIIQKIPFVALKVFQNIFPLNIIDIPHSSPKIIEEIVKHSNMILIHSWKTQAETLQTLSKIKKKYSEIPVICLLRDTKDEYNLKNLKDNLIREQKIQKISNYSEKEISKAEINLLKKQIFTFIKEKLIKKDEMDKLHHLFKQNQIYKDFTAIISRIENKLLHITPIGEEMRKIKIKQLPQEEKQKKYEDIKKMVKPEIMDILEFLTCERVKPIQSLVLWLFREKLRNYQNELNLKCVQIYELRDKFDSLKEDSNAENKTKRLRELDNQLSKLNELQPESILKKTEQQISKTIVRMANLYQNKIKPKIFSMELFWRELNYLINIDDNFEIKGQKLLNKMQELKQIQISHNLPFQIIDGDLLEISSKLMKQLFQSREDKVFVLTILGPQSSGKSTLLNFLFGCDFATSQGRCTRGVYGTYFKFAQNKGYFSYLTNCQGIFVIDTEGLFAITNDKDKEDEDRKDFDSKLVLFCMAVSDFVVVNVRGNFDLNTEKVVRLCHQRLVDLSIEKERRPELAIVLNQNASNKKEESQNQFKEIKKTIDCDICKSLSLAYKIVNYGQEEISLFEKNQKLTKKYPQQSFLKETTNLMNDILKKIARKRGVSTLSQIVEKFDRIWAMVLAFPNLSKAVTNQYRQLEKEIKEWRDNFDQDEKKELIKMYEDFKVNKIPQKYIIQQIQINQKKILTQFDDIFKEKMGEEEEIKFLRRQEKQKISSKTLVTIANIKYELQNIKLQKELKKSKIQGDCLLNQVAKDIANDGIQHTEQDLRFIFEKTFDQLLHKIQMTTNLGGQIVRQFESIEQNYEFLIRSHSEKGLPKDNMGWFGKQDCSVDEMLLIIQNKLLTPRQTRYEDVFEHTNKIHTNIFKGGKTDATLEYFSMKDYFHETEIIEYIGLNYYHFIDSLNWDEIKILIKKKGDQIKKQGRHHFKLKKIFNQINESLSPFNVSFSNFENFLELFDNQASYLQKFFNLFFSSKDKKKIYYVFSKFQPKRDYYHASYCKQAKLCKYLRKTQTDKFDHVRCLCSYGQSEAPHYLQMSFFNHINWDIIEEEVQKSQKLESLTADINRQITSTVNEELKRLNIKIIQANWIDFFEINSAAIPKRTFDIELIQKNSLQIHSFENVNQLLGSLSFVYSNLFKRYYKKIEEKDLNVSKQFIPLFVLKNRKFEPKKQNTYFQMYLKENTKLTIDYLKNRDFKKFIFQEIKESKGSLNKFFFNIFQIVKEVIESWKTFEKKTLSQIYNKVNREISKFNNDLNQISCKLSEMYIGYINLSVVYMIWKLVIDQKLSKKRQILESKKKEKEKEWQLFKDRVSKDEDKNVEGDLNQFLKEFIQLIKEQIMKKKEEYMNKHEFIFRKENKREKIQSLIDMDIFNKETSEDRILDYLEDPFSLVCNKYENLYEMSWNDLWSRYQSQRASKLLLKEFFDLLTSLRSAMQLEKIGEDKKSFNDLFQIAEEVTKMEDQSLPQDYHQEGKRVLFEYFIDVLLQANTMASRHCSKIEVKPLFVLKSVNMISSALSRILLEIKSIKYLSITNFPKFVNKLLSKDNRDKVDKEVQKLSELTKEDRENYRNLIKVVVCPQQCPCCGRICGIENEHQYHQCLYGHQMRGLNGTYIEREDKVKEASVIRCQQMAESDIIKYNGTQYTWIEFKQYWKAKKHGGWLYDDVNHLNPSSQDKFKSAWTVAGPIYCAHKNLRYVDFNQAEFQKKANAGNVHYIFALDQSGSMNRQWANLLFSLHITMEKIKEKAKGKNNIRISMMKFSNSIEMTSKNALPNQVNLNLIRTGGSTSFDPPFEKAASIASEFIKQSTIVFIFMTDGQADYPQKGIQLLKNLQIEYPKKLHFAGIQFKSKSNLLTHIAAELGGTCGRAYNPHELTDLFVKSIEVVEFKEKI